jgi:hypothetical protein
MVGRAKTRKGPAPVQPAAAPTNAGPSTQTTGPQGGAKTAPLKRAGALLDVTQAGVYLTTFLPDLTVLICVSDSSEVQTDASL